MTNSPTTSDFLTRIMYNVVVRQTSPTTTFVFWRRIDCCGENYNIEIKLINFFKRQKHWFFGKTKICYNNRKPKSTVYRAWIVLLLFHSHNLKQKARFFGEHILCYNESAKILKRGLRNETYKTKRKKTGQYFAQSKNSQCFEENSSRDWCYYNNFGYYSCDLSNLSTPEIFICGSYLDFSMALSDEKVEIIWMKWKTK